MKAWELVQRTIQHARFKEAYSLPSYGKSWRRLPRCQPVAPALVLQHHQCQACTARGDHQYSGSCGMLIRGQPAKRGRGCCAQERVRAGGAAGAVRAGL